MKTIKYKVISNESSIPSEFTSKAAARKYASAVRSAKWTARIIDMRTGEEVK